MAVCLGGAGQAGTGSWLSTGSALPRQELRLPGTVSLGCPHPWSWLSHWVPAPQTWMKGQLKPSVHPSPMGSEDTSSPWVYLTLPVSAQLFSSAQSLTIWEEDPLLPDQAHRILCAKFSSPGLPSISCTCRRCVALAPQDLGTKHWRDLVPN